MSTQITLQLFKDALPIPATIFPATFPNATVAIEMKVGTTTLHSDLPATTIWGYNGTYPGPIIEVNQNQKIHIEWKNSLKFCFFWPHFPLQLKKKFDKIGALPIGHRLCFPAQLPIKVITSNADTQCEAGTSSGTLDMDIPNIPPFTVVHLHGAKTHPDSDGWTENGILIDQSALYTYDNKDKATLFWFHDHAMGITRLNVYAGLAGLYIVRDPEELGLHLPSGGYEIPMVLQDRNLETKPNGDLTGNLVHKVEGRTVNYIDANNGSTDIIVQDGTMEFFGPFNLVNGKISPFLNVKRGVYRFRMVNGSNGRTYKLRLLDNATNIPFTSNILKQIGSDGGLFKNPITLKNNEIILAPGERADIIADFRGASVKGKKLNWVNIAAAPYDGTDVAYVNPKTLDNDPLIWNALRQKNACVIQFVVANKPFPINNFNMPSILSNSFVRMTHATLPTNHNHRLIALVEETKVFKDSNDNPIPDPLDPSISLTEPMLMLRELEPIALGEIIPVGEFSVTIAGLTYKSVASMFYDPINFIIRYGSLEVWKIINLTGDTHPFHIHLVQFQALGRQQFNEDIPNGNGTTNSVGASIFNITLIQSIPDDTLLDANEKGWKDTIRVNPNEIMSIAMTFDGYNGKYMYHCHLLEHEDKEMMRPFSVLPDSIVDKMNMGGHHH